MENKTRTKAEQEYQDFCMKRLGEPFGIDTSIKPQHTPTRCKTCLWIHEADSEKGTSFMGIQFCAVHERAVNNHEALIEGMKKLADECDGKLPYFVVRRLHGLISQAEGGK